MAAIRIEAYTRPNGRDGYECGYVVKHGDAVIAPPVPLAKFDMTPEGRREATMWRNGFAMGLRVAGEVLHELTL